MRGLPISAADRLDIVLMYADDIGSGDLNCYGATKVKTPTCDMLAAGSIRFTYGHSVALMSRMDLLASFAALTNQTVLKAIESRSNPRSQKTGPRTDPHGATPP